MAYFLFAGDMFVPPALIDQAAALLERDAAAAVATLATPIESLQEFLDPNVVKVVVADDGAETLLDAGESVTGAGRFVLGEVGMHVAVESGS